MFCPDCGAERNVDGTQYCTACGTLLGETRAPFRKGVKHGLILVVFGAVMIPIWMYVGAAFPPNDKLVESAQSTTVAEAAAWILMWMAFIAGVARIAYALVFERSRFENGVSASHPDHLAGEHVRTALNSADTFEPAQTGRWRTTDDLKTPVNRGDKRSSET